jgi:phosphoenolpyruvate-protein phosphotransferase
MAKAILVGRAGSPGVGLGRLLPIRPAAGAEALGAASAAVGHGAAPDASHPSVDERSRLLTALESAAEALHALAAQVSARAGEEIGAIFEAQALFARDPGIVEPALALVEAGQPADEAILTATERQADRLAGVDDEYFRERAADVRDVGRRVAALVRGEASPDLWRQDGHPAIVVADDLDPSAVATLRRELVGGIALAGGAPTGHAAIVARALGIPLVLGLGAAVNDLVADTDGAVDGFDGRLLIAPTDAEVRALEASSPLAVQPVDGHPVVNGISIAANVASELEAAAAFRAGADRIGLVRTELLFLGRHAPPGVAEQRATYARIRAAFPGRPIVFRTLDVGGDKPAGWQVAKEANPALGVRGIRLGLRNPTLLDDQLTAMLEAAAGGELSVMLPMISTRDELTQARDHLANALARLRAEGRPAAETVRLGVMIEVPSAAVMADALAAEADFFSIGTNDLVQYVLAADRTNPELAEIATALQPAILRLIDSVLRAATARGRHVAICGEAAADPEVLPLLVGLGVQELSVAPASVAAVRAGAAACEPEACRALAVRALAASTVDEVRALLAESTQAVSGRAGSAQADADAGSVARPAR